jgi:phage-related protein
MLTIAYAVDNKGRSPGKEFFDALPAEDQAKLMRLFKLLGDQARIANPEKFGNLKQGFREFKLFQIRMPCRFLPGGVVLITHGFRKKRDRAPREEIDRAQKIFQEDQQRAGRAGPQESRS